MNYVWSDKVTMRILALNSSFSRALGYDLNSAFLLRLLGFRIGRDVRFYGEAIHKSAEVQDAAYIGPGVRLGGNVKVGSGSIIRPGAVLAENVEIGEQCTIGELARLQNISIGSGTMIEFEVLCLGHGSGHIVIGRESYVGIRNVLDWSDDISIGDFVHIAGPSTAIWTHTSVYQVLHGDALADKTRRITKPVRIENNVYIGGNCTIYPGVTIGHHSIILPNSVVNDNVPPGVMAGGVPLRIIKHVEM